MATVTGHETEIIKSYKKQRSVLRITFSKLSNKILEIFQTEDYELEHLEADFNLLKDKNDKLKTLNEEILNSLYEADIDEANLEEEITKSDEYSSKFYLIECKYSKLIKTNDEQLSQLSVGLNSSKNSQNISNSRLNTNIRLPKIEFVKFNGDVKNWLNFWSQFKTVHSSNDLSNEEKFQYLLQATEPESRARLVVASFPPTEENYPKAIESLKSRFGREDLQTEVYVRELLNLTLSNFAAKKPISFLYDKIETQLRALDSLGVTSDKCAALLYPLIESCLSEDMIRTWQRSLSHSASGHISDEPLDLKTKLDSLVKFLKAEVESEERIKLAVNGFESCKTKQKPKFSSNNNETLHSEREGRPMQASAANLINCKTSTSLDQITNKCIFCSGAHFSENCFKARKMSHAEKIDILKKLGYCYLCLKPKHLARHCKAKLNCIICGKRHVPLMCNQDETITKTSRTAEVKSENSLSASSKSEVLLQTLSVYVKGENAVKRVRVLIDTGSQRSYITKKLAQSLKYEPIRVEKLKHSLFGGFQSDVKQHSCYRVRLQNLNTDYCCNFEVLDQEEICSSVPTAGLGDWVKELNQLGIVVTDDCSGEIEVLIGADIAGKLLTDQRVNLDCGIVAVGTLLGWTLMGKTSTTKRHYMNLDEVGSLFSTTTLLSIRDKPISQLWELDVLGIQDPVMKRSAAEEERAAQDFFENTVTTDVDGRYKVSLLWKEGHPPLPSNINIARKRLESTIKKLKETHNFNEYDSIFKEWESESIIEQIPSTDDYSNQGHYLPHRPVFKKDSTTKVRPVFDASAKEYNQPSLNDCLNTGVNLIERIPLILLGFRLNRIGVIADIKKAFLQISLYEEDRNFLKFLWIDEEGETKIYQHKRVVFGVSCSPFLLGATIKYHLLKTNESATSADVKALINILDHGFYVDNCVVSVSSKMELKSLIDGATELFARGKMELRGWEYTDSYLPQDIPPTSVLGMLWNKREDVLQINMTCVKFVSTEKITKRMILSTTHKIFDVIGITAPVTIVPKIILQELWKLKLKWDQEVAQEIKVKFLKWFKQLSFLSDIKIPRWLSGNRNIWSLHVFNDASKLAYGTVIFLRAESNHNVQLHFVAAKSRVSPIKALSIPRLELLAANIGSRLAFSIKQRLGLSESCVFYWSDSTTVLNWIQREDCWSTYVWNRTKEIRELSKKESWRYVPGSLNPADLVSRGCSAKELCKIKWWEGPEWLRKAPDEWPKNEFVSDEEAIRQEIKKGKGLVTSMVTTENTDNIWYYSYFSKFEKILRMVGWIYRFKNNCLNKTNKILGPLTVEELLSVEIAIIKFIQQECFCGVNDKNLSNLCPFIDDRGVIRIKTKLTQKQDTVSFRFPMVLPSKHPVVKLIIYDQHIKFCHVGVQTLLSILREKFWILNGRKTIRAVLRHCVTCLRHKSRSLEAEPVCLPDDRVAEVSVFQVCGVDFAGPLLMKNNVKGWVCLFTCAVYRAVHLELVTSLSTNDFIQCLRRFISRRGRPSICYSDNGTNFVGTNNLMSQLDWNRIEEFSSVHRIRWKFNPPASPWWGGWWERLVGLMKQLLRRVLGKAFLSYEELYTILCDCESVLNSRPLTYVSDDPNDLTPLTPAMFLTDIKQSEVHDLDMIVEMNLNKRLRYRQKLKRDLRKRFRTEYLGMLTTRPKLPCRQLKKGEVVMIQSDDKRRLQWPLALVEEVIPGKDKEIRLARLRTKSGTVIRPVQKIHPLEVRSKEETKELQGSFEKESKVNINEKVSRKKTNDNTRVQTTSRSGRLIKLPPRLSD